MFNDQTYHLKTSSWRLILLSAVSVTLLGCVQKIESVSSPDDEWEYLLGDQPLRFVSSLESTPSTKADLPANSTFGVMAYFQEGDIANHVSATWSDSRWPSFMYNQKVTFDGTDYEYHPIKYWPNNKENTISFWAYSPHNADAVFYKKGTTDSFDNTSLGLPDLQFSVISGKDDFMTADLVKDQAYASTNSGTDGRVKFTFQHRLARVKFQAKTAADYSSLHQSFKIQKIEILNHYNTGVLSQDISAEPNSVTWSRVRGENTPVVAFTGEKALTAEAADCAQVFMIPQNIRHTGTGESGKKVTAYVEYELTVNNVSIQHEATVELDLGASVLAWEANKTYLYTLIFSPKDGLAIKVTVQPWEYWLGIGDYEENVTVTKQLTWDSQTYDRVLNNQEFTVGAQTKEYDVVVLKANTELVGSFSFDTPYHGTWVAMLEPIAGSDFESIVFDNGEIQKAGVVGGELSISIKAGSGEYSHNQYALLRFMCQTEAGQTLAVQDGAIGGPYVIALYVN